MGLAQIDSAQNVLAILKTWNDWSPKKYLRPVRTSVSIVIRSISILFALVRVFTSVDLCGSARDPGNSPPVGGLDLDWKWIFIRNEIIMWQFASLEEHSRKKCRGPWSVEDVNALFVPNWTRVYTNYYSYLHNLLASRFRLLPAFLVIKRSRIKQFCRFSFPRRCNTE